MNLNQLNPGDFLSSTMYAKVESVDLSTESMIIQQANGKRIQVGGKQMLEGTFSSASQFDKEEKVTRTELAQIFNNLGDQVFTANFDKQDGTNRTLIGYKVDNSENLMGRVNVIDLQASSASPVGNRRQIDLRTTKFLITNNVKYTVKK